MLWGTALGLTPFLAVQIVALVMRIAGTSFDVVRWNPVVSLGIVMIPISMGYAIIRHHIFDITFVVRRGLQYLLLTLGGQGDERRRLESILRQTTALDPADRYSTVTAMMRDFGAGASCIAQRA